MRAKKCAAALIGALAFVAIGLMNVARAEDIHIALDQAFPIRLGTPAAGVAVGNPNIAGVSVQDDQLLFVTGRAYGATNLVIVGDNGRMLYSGRVIVSPDETGAVMVTRGTQTTRMQCSPLCRERPDVGGAGAEVNR
jgi:Flp pilus assembly secretin CpaC